MIATDDIASYVDSCIKPEPNMLKSLPVIVSSTSQKIYPLFLFYSHIITYYSYFILFVLLFCVLTSRETWT